MVLRLVREDALRLLLLLLPAAAPVILFGFQRIGRAHVRW